jgi:tellurite resistance protein
MAGLAPVELTADCAACGLEGGVVEVYDALVAACRFGIPATTRCKLCAAESRGTFERSPSKPLRDIPANLCPACLHELGPSAVDERRCPSCGARAALEETAAPTTFGTRADLGRALDAWAEREQFASREALASATFVEPDIGKLFAVLQRREPIEVLADPFANMGMRTVRGSGPSRERTTNGPPRLREEQSGARASAASAANASPAMMTSEGAPPETRRGLGPGAEVPVHPPAPALPVALMRAPSPDAPVTVTPQRSAFPDPAMPAVPRHVATEPTPLGRTLVDPAYAPTDPLAPPLPPPPPSAPPRAIVFPLVSVIAADGEIHPEERALVDRFLESEGLAPLADHEFCVHHPSEVAHLVPRSRREDVVKLMCETAAIDGMPDESERRVIRAYATAWDVDDEKLDFWMWGYETMNASLARQLFLKLRRFVLSARWGEAEEQPR